jgi:hypothetical protein
MIFMMSHKNLQTLMLLSTIMTILVGAVTVWHIVKTHKEADEQKKAILNGSL